MADEVLASLVWSIENFDQLMEKRWGFLSLLFKAGSIGLQLELVLDSEYLKIELINSTLRASATAEYRISLVDKDGKNSYSCSISYDAHRTCIENFRLSCELIAANRDSLLPQNRLTVRCDVMSVSVDEGYGVASKAAEREAEVFSHHMGQLLESGAHSDLELLSNDGEVFKVHEFILLCRCVKLLRYPSLRSFVPGTTDQYHIDVNGQNLQTILKYIYTGTLDRNSINPDLSRHLCHYELMDSLRSLCSVNREIVNVVTTILPRTLSLNWLIRDYDKLRAGQEIFLVHDCTKNEQDQLVITFQAERRESSAEDDIQIKFMNLNSRESPPICVKILIRKQNAVVIEKQFEEERFADEMVCCFNVPRRDDNLGDSDLVIDITMLKYEERISSQSVTTESDAKKEGVFKNVRKLQEDFWELIYHPQFSDTTLCIGNRKYKAHKAILAARSAAFARMFARPGAESKEGLVIAENTSPTALELWLLPYIYSGCIERIRLSRITSFEQALRLC